MTVSDPQTWTIIGVFAAAVLGGLTLVSTMLSRVVRAEIGGLRGELGGDIAALRAEMHGRFATVDARLDHLDRDVQALTDRYWGRDRDE
jgi:hypothetical protein